ncbi:MAG: DbpA RNA binding domain-containing protein, partial [Pseudomonadales bacterium]|nr:DbpA RNA binding domain-containing protein [Pseudomonadales bacterium]
APNITQKYWRVAGLHKLDALTRILEMQSFEAMLIFVRTKSATIELAEKLTARGYACEALNGDIPQQQRERTVDKLRKGRLDILVATDVVARGLDVDRISVVLNYDIPYDTESYVHRIGRTGRAGRKGEAILFVSAREQRMLRMIENATNQKIEPMSLPSPKEINVKRVDKFKAKISEVMDSSDLSLYMDLLKDYQQEHDADPLHVAAALASIVQGDTPLLISEKEHRGPVDFAAGDSRDRGDRGDRGGRERGSRKERGERRDAPQGDMQCYVLAVGREHGVKPGNIVGAIANEADIDSKYIGQIEIQDTTTLIDLPAGMPKNVMEVLRKVSVCGQKLNLKQSNEKISKSKPRRSRPRSRD